MFNIAYNVETDKQHVDVKVVDASFMHFEDGKKTSVDYYKELDVSISGMLNNKECSLNFIITKPVDEYLKIEKYKEEEICPEKLTDLYFNEDDVTDFSLEIKDMKVLRYSDSLIFSFYFYESNYRYFGNAEFEVDVDLIEKELKK